MNRPNLTLFRDVGELNLLDASDEPAEATEKQTVLTNDFDSAYSKTADLTVVDDDVRDEPAETILSECQAEYGAKSVLSSNITRIVKEAKRYKLNLYLV